VVLWIGQRRQVEAVSLMFKDRLDDAVAARSESAWRGVTNWPPKPLPITSWSLTPR